MKATSVLALLSALVSPALAHYRWTSLIVGGTVTGQYQYVRTYTAYNSPTTDVTSLAIRCNANATPVAGIATAAAGSSIGFQVDNTLYHPGVINVYLAKVPAGSTAATWDGSGTVWFRISQLSAVVGPMSGGPNLQWPAESDSSWSFQIPAATPSGDYLVRIEHIALHVANTFGGAQFYISCGQVTVTGGGSGTPGPLVAFPGAYTGNEPGILVNINVAQSSYTHPGPALWPAGSSGGGGSPPVTTANPASSTTTAKAGTSTTPSVTTTASGPTVTHYGQCGGTGWTGATVCASPYTCKASSAYYSQCL